MGKIPDDIEIDDDAVRFRGKARWLLLGLLKRAKFAEDYEPKFLFSPWVAKLASHLTGVLAPNSDLQSYADDPMTRFEIAKAIAHDADHIGWWRMTRTEKGDFLQSVVAAPHRMSSETVEEIVLSVTEEVERARRLVAAADVIS